MAARHLRADGTRQAPSWQDTTHSVAVRSPCNGSKAKRSTRRGTRRSPSRSGGTAQSREPSGKRRSRGRGRHGSGAYEGSPAPKRELALLRAA